MATVMITGANRGIGLELARQYAADGWRVIAGCRAPESATDLQALGRQSEVRILALDVASSSSIAGVRKALDGVAIDVLVNNAGLFGPKPGADKDLGQSFGSIRYEVLEEVWRTNTLGPLQVTEALIGNVTISSERKAIMISSSVGSIATTEGGLYAYRTSKVAVNMIVATLAKDLARRGVHVLAICPGWTQTRMGGPDAPISVAASVAGIRARIAELDAATSGQFRQYDGVVLPW
ncbi:MAG TPA: SDR family oxidoreductase [Steroidobacteraceae bacterium]|nr:SDR family oxidoreductase [Steroidobacteraceae bacterium]HRX88787.1 SDR family oxidoreductase [Steroidobacteraceae bacterium]